MNDMTGQIERFLNDPERCMPSERARLDAAAAAYFDDRCPERNCDYCGRPYRGPAVYCCLAHAIADA